jgi:hypothetical protein
LKIGPSFKHEIEGNIANASAILSIHFTPFNLSPEEFGPNLLGPLFFIASFVVVCLYDYENADFPH